MLTALACAPPPAPPASGKLRRVRGHGVDRRLGQPRAALAVVRGPGLLLRAVAHDPDAEETRQVVRGIMGESRASDDSPQGLSDEAAEDMERELELELEAQEEKEQEEEEQQQQADERPIEVMAERIGPPLQQQQSEPPPQNELVLQISQLLGEMHERCEAPELGELSPGRQQVLDELHRGRAAGCKPANLGEVNCQASSPGRCRNGR